MSDAKIFRSAPFARQLPRACLRRFFLLCLAAVLATIVLHSSQKPSSLDQDAQNAARRMLTCLQELKAMRQEVAAEMESVRNDFSMFSDTDFTLNPALDPALSGLIGVEYTDLTTTLGDLRAKQTSLHPQFAALVVMWLKAAGVKPGDMAAISFSGSFPALNLAVLCACDELQLHPVIFSSVGASAYGANIPGFTWLDMEARLYEKQLIGGRTRYASLGGILDMDGGIGETGIRLGEAAIAGHGAEYVHEGTSRNVITDIERRLELYTQEGPPAVFISVGGNVTSLGWVTESALLGNGLLLPPGTGDSAFEGATRWIPETDSPQRGIIFRMFEVGTPVLHLLNIERLAAANNLPMAPVELSIDHDLHLAWRNREISLAILFFLWLLSGGLCLVGQCRPLESADDD